MAAPLLGHRSFQTTEKYYRHAKAQAGHRLYIEALFGNQNSRDQKG
jgi:integrase